jgi:FAD-dependent urate hydroxylase
MDRVSVGTGMDSDTKSRGAATVKNIRVSAPTQQEVEIAIIGAGPYGLSAAAHLKARGVEVRVFGEPMEFWANKMPEGMLLRSPRVASNISDPNHAYSLEAYEASAKISPAAPLPLSTFVEYGRWFRHHLGSALDRRTVARVEQDSGTFLLTMEDGETIRAPRVVVATGIGPFRKKPAIFKDLPPLQISHCYEGRDVKRFAGKRVVVIGAGQSSLESAALLHEAGAEVELIVRKDSLRWIGKHKWLHQLGPITQMLYSEHDVGPVGISRLVAYPRLVSCIPLKIRDKIRKRAVKPGGSQWLPARLAAVKTTTGQSVSRARTVGDEVALTLEDGSERRADHVLCGTGYQVDLARYDFLPRELTGRVQQFEGYPKLSRGFSTSVPGLHFIGATAARSFGPLLYFVAGTEFASSHLASQICK